MFGLRIAWRTFALALVGGVLLAAPAAPQQEGLRGADPKQEGPRPGVAAPQDNVKPAPPKGVLAKGPGLEPIAETIILMDGINLPNFAALDKELRKRPANDEAWAQVRGQSLLIAENGNLLMLRPPKKKGQEAWLERAANLRTSATRLARAAADSDFENCRQSLIELSKACNRCHQTFRVDIQVTPFKDKVISNDNGNLPPVPDAPAPPPLPPVPKLPPVPRLP